VGTRAIKKQKYEYVKTKRITMMNFTKIITTGFLFAGVIGTAFGDDLSVQIQKTRSECTGISDKLDELKRKAGIGVVATGAGTVSGGVALGTGIAKSKLDSKIRDWKSELNDLISAQSVYEQEYQKIENMDELLRECNSGKLYALQKDIDENKNAQTKLQSDIDAATDKSKTLGKIRTGTLAGTAVADTAGVLLAAGNKVDDDLKQMVEKCIRATDELKDAALRARYENTATDLEIAQANKIVQECSNWKNIDISKIDNRAKGAAVSGGAGAALALVGAITSASANSASVRNGDDKKEQNLNTTSNVLAGGATAASLTSVVFSATQINAIKKASDVANKCEEALQ
jgi:hypothetical protein